MLNALTAETVSAARSRVNAWLGAGMADPARAYLGRVRQLKDYAWNSYGDDDLRGSDQVHACFRPLEEALRRVIGADTEFRYTPRQTQVALRFPQSVGVPHIDGLAFGRPFPWQVPAGIVVVYLSNVGPDDAPLTVWPQAMADIQDIARRALGGYPPDRAKRELRARLRRLSLGDGAEPVTGPAGTVVVTHPALPHCNGPAAGPDVRYALIRRYYRRSWFDGEHLLPQTWDDAMAVLADDDAGGGARWTAPAAASPLVTV